MPTIVCPSCTAKLQVPDAHTRGKCPRCGYKIKVSPATDGHAARSEPLANADGHPTDQPTQKTIRYPIALRAQRIRLAGLTAAAFQHPLDQQATAALKSLKGFDWLVSKFIEYGIERAEYVTNIGSNIRVGPRQLPQLYEMLREGCAILDVPEPELYVQQGEVNAYTSGHNAPFIILQTDLLDVLNDDEIMGVIAHELGHIKCGHVLYYTMARFIGPVVQILGEMTLGIGALLGAGVESSLLAWKRRSEFSADRAALLVMQDARPCVSMLMKLAGGSHRWAGRLDPEQFLNQARAYGEGLDQSKLDRVYRFFGAAWNLHPACVERARALDDWVGSAEYQDILSGRRRSGSVLEGVSCPACSTPVAAGVKFCAKCGTPLRTR